MLGFVCLGLGRVECGAWRTYRVPCLGSLCCGLACCRWPLLATIPRPRVFPGHGGSRLSVSRFGRCHRPWQVIRALGFKNPKGYWLSWESESTYNIQGGGVRGGVGIRASVTGRIGSYSLSPLCERTVCPRSLRTPHGALEWHILSSLCSTTRLMPCL